MIKVKIIFDNERCKGCGLCANACIKNIIELSENEMNSKGCRPYKITKEKECIGCMSCALVCPDCAIKIEREK